MICFKKGRDEFNQPASKIILGSVLLVSIVQLIITGLKNFRITDETKEDLWLPI